MLHSPFYVHYQRGCENLNMLKKPNLHEHPVTRSPSTVMSIRHQYKSSRSNAAHGHKQQTAHQILWEGMEQSSEVISAVPTQKGFVENKADLTEKLHAYSGGGSFS